MSVSFSRFGIAMSITRLDHFIRVYDTDLDAAFCRQMIESFQNLERFQARNGRGVRAGLENSAWSELNVSRLSDQGFLSFFRQRIDQALARYNADVGLTLPLPNSLQIADLTMKRYRPEGEQFQLHFDAVNHMAHRYLVLLWYLNDVADGGETDFPQLDRKVEPRTGRLLMFPPYWMYQHAGLPPVSGDKYIISTYLLFADPSLAS
jgi:prolyl 4-hydroxylase